MSEKERNYKAKVIESSRELSVHEKIQFKDFTGAFKITNLIDSMDSGKYVLEGLDSYVVISVHNESSKNPDYHVYLFISQSGDKYMTSSESAWRSFKEIEEELLEAGEGIEGINLGFAKHKSSTQQNPFIKTSLE